MDTTTNRFKTAGLIFFFLFTLFICISKSAVEILSGLLLALAIVCLLKTACRNSMAANRPVFILLLTLAAGFLMSLFSLSGPLKGAAGFVEQYRFFLLVLPFSIFATSEKSMNFLFTGLNLSALISMSYGIFEMNFHNIWGESIGFHAIGRNSDMLISIALMNLTMILSHHFESRVRAIAVKTIIGINTAFMVTAVFLMLRRGSYLGLMAGVSILLVLMRKTKILALIVLVLCSVLYFSDIRIVDRVKSIMDFNGDESNRERIQLLRTGTDFLMDEHLFFHGTGAEQSKSPFTTYFYSHPPEYQHQNRDIIKKQYFGNFHNSFLQMAVEDGVFFLLMYLSTIGYILLIFGRSLSRLPDHQKIYPMAAIVVTIGFFISQFFHSDLYSYGGIPFILMFAAGCQVITQHRIQNSNTATDGHVNADTEKYGD